MARSKSQAEQKRLHEKTVVTELIQLYCRQQHKGIDKNDKGLCPDCQA
ncbi:MAG: hypothetical protein HUJ84_03340, partial [Veillonella sp.]|nr:hypothetical protein [Veillonella sp.]